MKYRFGGGEKQLCFGAYPEVTLVAAGEARDRARAEIRAGSDRLWMCHGLVPDPWLPVKRHCAHDPEYFIMRK